MADYHPEAVRLANAAASHFFSADHDLQWTSIEREHSLWLDANTVLVGKIDSEGIRQDGELFFGDWKTASQRKARFIESEKSQWRMSPQALTYGVLKPDCRWFTVRWIAKTTSASCFHEWYSYNEAELKWWQGELQIIAGQIRAMRRALAQWPTNLTNCTRYGEAYACPFRDQGCWKLKFDHVPEEMRPRFKSHLEIENEIKGVYPLNHELVVLDASRVGDWLGCNEYYRRMWEGDGLTEDNEALTIGADFHTLYGLHLAKIKEGQNAG